MLKDMLSFALLAIGGVGTFTVLMLWVFAS